MRLPLRGADLLRGRVRRAAAGSVLAGVALQTTIAVSGIVSARLLGVEDRGRFALLWVAVVVVSHGATLGLQSSISFAVARGEAVEAVVGRLRRPIALQLAAAPVLAGAIALATIGPSSPDLLAAAVMVAGAPAFVLLVYGIAIAQGQRRYRAVQLHRLLEPLLFAGALVGLALADKGDLLEICVAWMATLVAGGLFAWRQGLGRWWPTAQAAAPGGTSSQELSRFGRRSFLGTLGATEHTMLDQLVVGILLSPFAFGLYVAANAFCNLPRFLGQSVGLVAYPEVAAAPPASRGHVLRRFALTGAAVTAPVVLVLIGAIGWLLPFLFGDSFRDAVPVARILLLAAFLQSVRRVLSEASRGMGSGVPGTVSEVAFLASFAAVVIPLTAAFDELGAAWAVAIASLAGCATLAVVLARSPGGGPAGGPTQEPEIAELAGGLAVESDLATPGPRP